MRRRLLNVTQGDPAAEAIKAVTERRLGDVARLHFQQPHIATRRETERVTDEVKDFENDGKGAGFQGPGSGMSSREGVLPPPPPAPRPKLTLKK
jgi:hypothetical protein